MAMAVPISKLYAFDKLISENDLSQTWLAKNLKIDEECLVKVPAPNQLLDISIQKSILSTSYELQGYLRTSKVVRTKRKYVERGCLFIEYPLLDLSKWEELTPKLLDHHFEHVLPQMALIVDYVHLLGLVHCDLKLNNFMANTSSAPPIIVLVDMDFLCLANSTPDAKLFGTPEHIAQEILSNDRVVAQSDIFSIGVSLKHYLHHARRVKGSGSEPCSVSIERLENLTIQLTNNDYLSRPRFFLDALHKHGILKTQEYRHYQNTLLAMLVLSRFRSFKNEELNSFKGMRVFLREKNQIMGFSDDFVQILAKAYAKDKLTTFRLFKNILSGASLERHADYWHIALSDKRLLETYSSLHALSTSSLESEPVQEHEANVPTHLTFEFAKELKAQGYLEWPFLVLKEAIQSIDASGLFLEDTDVSEICFELGNLAHSLNRLDDADVYLGRFVELLTHDRSRRLHSTVELLSWNAQLGRKQRVEKLLGLGGQLAAEEISPEWSLRLERFKAWMHVAKGDHSKAHSCLKSILDRANGLELFDLVMLAFYNIGILYWRRGNFHEAESNLLKSFDLAQDKNLLSEAVPVISTLSLIYSELADYVKSVKFGKLALKIGMEPRHSRWQSSTCLAVVYALTRLAEHHKAEYWLQRYLSMCPANNSKSHLLTYYHLLGFSRVNQGDLASAKEALHKALELVDSSMPSKPIGKIYHNLAEVALFQGDYADCEVFSSKSRSVFQQINDQASLAEIDLIVSLDQLYNVNTDDQLTGLTAVVDRLLKQDCRYYAILGLFHLILNGTDEERIQAAEKAIPILHAVTSSKPPLFRAMSALVEFVEGTGSAIPVPVSSWKKAFTVFLNANFTFLAMLVGRQLARCYEDESKSINVRKFLQQSLRLAEGLSNTRFADEIKLKLTDVAYRLPSDKLVIDSLHGVSLILKSISNYNQSLRQVVEFAVNNTGAERGVLLLKSAESSQLYVVAAVNCDDQSLTDVTDFSSKVPKQAFDAVTPVIIENALSDRRTNKYQSILFHNIQSVACFPLIYDEKPLGVLYLDHHSIPALFSDEDLTYISSMANFIAVILSTVQDFRTLNRSNLELQYGLKALGSECSFVTKDPAMLRLLEQLPRLAPTRTPILIQGESGSGKEILCQAIHSMSQRANKPLVKLNCAAIASSLIEGELFGVAKGAATGVAEREGKLAAADDGTLFLDEIGNMSMDAQAKVLRAVEQQEFEKVGSNRTIHTDIRFIYATNRDLLELVKQGRFRDDLYYRINTINVTIPPLRNRPDDIPLLIGHFMQLYSTGKKPPRITSEVFKTMMAYSWPGNVRELRNVVERCCILFPGLPVDAAMLPKEILEESEGPLAKEAKARIEAFKIASALAETKWNQAQAARLLGVPPSTLRRKIKKHNITKTF